MSNAKEVKVYPKDKEEFKDFFQRTFDTVKNDFSQDNFWLLETIGRRVSFAGGNMDVCAIEPKLSKISDDFTLAFRAECAEIYITEVTAFYQKIMQKYY